MFYNGAGYAYSMALIFIRFLLPLFPPVYLLMYSISIPIMIWVLRSAAEPLAISRNLALSFSVDRSMTSAMFDGIERLERVIWL